MPSRLAVEKIRPVFVNPTGGNAAIKIENISATGTKIYYGEDSEVSSSHNTGTIEPASSVEVLFGKWLIANENAATASITQVPGSINKAEAEAIKKTTKTTIPYYVEGAVTAKSLSKFVVAVKSGETASLVACRYIIETGTSATFEVRKNSGAATGFTSLKAEKEVAEATPTAVSLANNDELFPKITAVAGSPVGLSVWLVIERTF